MTDTEDRVYDPEVIQSTVRSEPDLSPPTFPRQLEDGRVQYAALDDSRFADPFQPLHHPRNDPDDPAFRFAMRERQLDDAHRAAQRMRDAARDADGHLVDEEGNRLDSPWEEIAAAENSRLSAILETVPTWRSDGLEWLNPDLPEGDPSNDPNNAGVLAEIRRRERDRRAAFVNQLPQTGRRLVPVDVQMREAGLLAPVEKTDAELRRDAVMAQYHDDTRQLAEKVFPPAVEDANLARAEIAEKMAAAYKRGDLMTARTLEHELEQVR